MFTSNSFIAFSLLWENVLKEWYPWGLQISLHIRSPAVSEMWGGGGRYSGVNFGHLKSEVFRNGGGGGGGYVCGD